MILRDLTFSRCSCASSAMLLERRLTFSARRFAICALSSSIRMLSVELSLPGRSRSVRYLKRAVMQRGTHLVMCLLARRNFFLTGEELRGSAQCGC